MLTSALLCPQLVLLIAFWASRMYQSGYTLSTQSLQPTLYAQCRGANGVDAWCD